MDRLSFSPNSHSQTMNLSVRSDYDLRTWHFAGVGDWQMSLENVGKFLSPGMQMSEACKV